MILFLFSHRNYETEEDDDDFEHIPMPENIVEAQRMVNNYMVSINSIHWLLFFITNMNIASKKKNSILAVY